MAIFVVGTPKNVDPMAVIERAIGLNDTHGKPFGIIHLDWNPRHPCYEGDKTQGFHDTRILWRQGGGLTIQHAPTGCAVWRPDPFSGMYTSIVSDTPVNRRVLASCLSDPNTRWTIRDSKIMLEVKQLEAELFEELKTQRFAVIDPTTGEQVYDENDQPLFETAYDRMVKARSNRKDRRGYVFQPERAVEEQQRNAALASQLQKQNEELQRRIDELTKTGVNINKVERELRQRGEIQEYEYSREQLAEMKPMRVLKDVARKFEIEFDETTEKGALIDKIMQKQEALAQQEVVG